MEFHKKRYLLVITTKLIISFGLYFSILIKMITKINLRSSAKLKILANVQSKGFFLKNNHKKPSFFSTIYFTKYIFSEVHKKKIFQEIQQLDSEGTQYTNWILARSQSHNHDIAHLKRKFLKDRFSIHKLTNVKFLCALASHKTQYNLNTNEKIILLAQLNHVFNVLGKEKRFYNEFHALGEEIIRELKDPYDLICMGTFLSTLSNVGNFNYDVWISAMDSLIVKKSDEQYDQIFGIISALAKYKDQILSITQFHQAKGNMILQFIPVIYRNHLQLVRQFVKYNIYNLKQCRILFRCLYSSRINERYFWKSINDWFNIYIKEQISKKNIDEFFIVNEKVIDKVINDDGIIRPRPILQEITEIAFILGENLTDSHGILREKDKYPLKRYLQFVEDLVLYTIKNGSALYINYLDNHQHKVQRQTISKPQDKHEESTQQILLNQEFQTGKQQQLERIKIMQRDYKTLFVNPIQIKNETIIQLLIVMRKCCGYDSNGNIPQRINTQNSGMKQSRNQEEQQKPQSKGQSKPEDKFQFVRPEHLIDTNVLKWLVMRLCKQEMHYTIPQLLQIIKSQDFMSFANVNLDQLILSKLLTIRNQQVGLKDLRQLMLFLPISNFNELQPILTTFLTKSHPSQIHQLTRIIQLQSISQNDEAYPAEYPRKQQNQKWLPRLTFYFMQLPQMVNLHYKYYSFEENCYFLYYLLKSQVYWEEHIYEGGYLGEMEKLKQAVKLESYSRGFKLKMDSYFYKLLNYVDLVQFFEGGNG